MCVKQEGYFRAFCRKRMEKCDEKFCKARIFYVILETGMESTGGNFMPRPVPGGKSHLLYIMGLK